MVNYLPKKTKLTDGKEIVPEVVDPKIDYYDGSKTLKLGVENTSCNSF